MIEDDLEPAVSQGVCQVEGTLGMLRRVMAIADKDFGSLSHGAFPVNCRAPRRGLFSWHSFEDLLAHDTLRNSTVIVGPYAGLPQLPVSMPNRDCPIWHACSWGLRRFPVPLLLTPLDLRTGLAELSAESGVGQREIIRQAIRRLWEDGPSAIQANARTSTVKTTRAEETTVKAKAAKTVHQVTPTVSIVKTESELPHADRPAAKLTKTESRLPSPPLTTLGSSEGPVATGEPGKAVPSDNLVTPVTPGQTQRVPKGPDPLPFPEPRNPVDLSQINLDIPSTGASRGDCGV